MRFRAVIFDLDDTLYDEITFVRGAMKDVAVFMASRTDTAAPQVFELLIQELERSGRGHVFDAVVAELGLPISLVPTLVYVYRSARPPITLFAEADALLRRLRASGMPIGVVTDGTALVQGAKVELLGLRDRADAVILTDAVGAGRPKPAPDGFEIACELLGVPPAESAYVANDLRKDFIAPRTLGMRTIHVVHRQLGTLDGLSDHARPDEVVETLAGVWALVRAIGLPDEAEATT